MKKLLLVLPLAFMACSASIGHEAVRGKAINYSNFVLNIPMHDNVLIRGESIQAQAFMCSNESECLDVTASTNFSLKESGIESGVTIESGGLIKVYDYLESSTSRTVIASFKQNTESKVIDIESINQAYFLENSDLSPVVESKGEPNAKALVLHERLLLTNGESVSVSDHLSLNHLIKYFYIDGDLAPINVDIAVPGVKLSGNHKWTHELTPDEINTFDYVVGDGIITLSNFGISPSKANILSNFFDLRIALSSSTGVMDDFNWKNYFILTKFAYMTTISINNYH